MFIDINKIGPEGVELDTSLDLPGLEGASGETLQVRSSSITATMMKVSRGAEIRGRLDAVVQVVCSRCLEPMDEPVGADFFLLAVPGPEEEPAAGADSDLQEEQLQEAMLTVTEGRLDLTAVAAEQIYLNLSRKPICSRGCLGLCAGCGVNRNNAECQCSEAEIDPRLAPLKKFRKN
jgi:uncharacterized protein